MGGERPGVSQQTRVSESGRTPNLRDVADEDREELRSLAEHLVGPAEIGKLLKIEPNTVNVWKVRHPDFPAPVRRLKTGDVWDVREVQSWAEKTGRYPLTKPSSGADAGT